MSAEAKNLILFDKMAKKMIDGDFENFREATSLLTTWLSKRQAYYPGALLQIIRLLFIAQLRVRNEVKFNHALALLFKAQQYSENPFAAAYIKLVNAILPFQDVFLEAEKGLREGYQQLVASVSADPPEHEIPQSRPPTPRPTNSVESTNEFQIVPGPTPISEAIPTGQVPSVAGLDPVLESLIPTSGTQSERVELGTPSTAESKSPTPTLSIPQHTIESPRSSPSPESKENILSVNLKASEQQIRSPTEPQPIAPDPPVQTEIQPVDKLPPASEHMRALDILCPFPSPPPIADTGSSTSSPPIQQQHAPAPTPPRQIGITTLNIKTLDFDLSANWDLLRQKAHTPQGQQQSNDTVNPPQGILSGPLASDPGTIVPNSDIAAHLLQGAILTDTARAGTDAKSNEVTEVIVGSIPVSGTLSPEQNVPLGSAEVASQPEVDTMKIQKAWNEPIASEDSTDNTVARMEINCEIQNGRNEAPSNGESNAMEVDDLGSGKSTAPPNPVLKQAVNVVANTHAPTESMKPTKVYFPPASVELGVIARQQGLKDSFRIFIEFDITRSQSELIKNWSKRLGDLAGLKSSICISLGCYLLADLKVQLDTGRLSSFEQQVACTPSKWPQQRGSLSLKVISAESKEENLPLSPPFQVTPNNLLDISDLVTEGKNKLQLHQTTDLRHFLFVLHAHHPTRQQLEQVQGYMHKRKEWQQFLQDFAAPFAYDSFRSLLSSYV